MQCDRGSDRINGRLQDEFGRSAMSACEEIDGKVKAFLDVRPIDRADWPAI